MGKGARVSHPHLVGKSASPTQHNGKNKRTARWTNTAEVACPGKWLAAKEYVRKNGNPQAALPQGARVKCWGFALGQPGFLKVYGPEGVTKGRVIARGKTIIESLQTDDEFRAVRDAHSESSQMSGTIEVVVVNSKDMRRRTEMKVIKNAAETIARALMLNLNRKRLVQAITKLLEQGVEDDFVASVAKRTGKAAPKGRADQDTNWRRNDEPVKAPIERRSRQRNQQTTRHAGRSDVASWR